MWVLKVAGIRMMCAMQGQKEGKVALSAALTGFYASLCLIRTSTAG